MWVSKCLHIYHSAWKGAHVSKHWCLYTDSLIPLGILQSLSLRLSVLFNNNNLLSYVDFGGKCVTEITLHFPSSWMSLIPHECVFYTFMIRQCWFYDSASIWRSQGLHQNTVKSLMIGEKYAQSMSCSSIWKLGDSLNMIFKFFSF